VNVRRRRRNRPHDAHFSLVAREPRPGAPAIVSVTVQLGPLLGWTRLLTAASAPELATALAPDLSRLAESVWGDPSKERHHG
jgi:hypothetical protein